MHLYLLYISSQRHINSLKAFTDKPTPCNYTTHHQKPLHLLHIKTSPQQTKHLTYSPLLLLTPTSKRPFLLSYFFSHHLPPAAASLFFHLDHLAAATHPHIYNRLIQLRPPPAVREVVSSFFPDANTLTEDAEIGEALKSFCRRMDSGGLLRYMTAKRKEVMTLRIQVASALAEALDAPRLVLDTVKDFLEKKDVNTGPSDRRRACGNLIMACFLLRRKRGLLRRVLWKGYYRLLLVDALFLLSAFNFSS